MKKLLLLALVCGINTGVYAQPQDSDKWVITPVANMKGVLGKLDINFPADIERNILIYQQADNKFLRSVSRNDKIYTIAPGEYRFTLTNVPVENVPIKKGHETRLKAGFLDIVSEGHWDLYDETKEKAYTSGNKPKKLPLPVGKYQIKLGGQFYPVIIKDGETVEDYTPAEVNDDLHSTEKARIIDTAKWVMAPTKEPEKGDSGRINLQFPEGIPWSVWVGNAHFNTGFDSNPQSNFYNTQKSALLPVDKYTVTLNGIHIINVPIEKNKLLRIKAGVIESLTQTQIFPAHIYDENLKLNVYPELTTNGQYQQTLKWILPAGKYYLQRYDDPTYYPVIVRDGGTTKFELTPDGKLKVINNP